MSFTHSIVTQYITILHIVDTIVCAPQIEVHNTLDQLYFFLCNFNCIWLIASGNDTHIIIILFNVNSPLNIDVTIKMYKPNTVDQVGLLFYGSPHYVVY